MAKDDKIKATKLEIGLPFDLGKITFVPDDAQKIAAWELYVELTTRISVQELKDDEGLVREALSSLYSLFNITRGILRKAGPGVAKNGSNSLGAVAIAVLNVGMRPFLSKWHPILQTYEAQRKDGVSPREHEDAWDQIGEIRQELKILRGELAVYALALEQIAGVELTQ